MTERNDFIVKKITEKFTKVFQGNSLPLQTKRFYLAVLYTIPIFLLSISVIMIVEEDIFIVLTMLGVVLVIAGIAYMAHNYRRYEEGSVLLCIFLNFFAFPLMFLLFSGVYGAMPLYFTTGIILTFFLLQGKKMVIIVAAECLWYSLVIFYSVLQPNVVYAYGSKDTQSVVILAVSCYIIAALGPVFMNVYQAKIQAGIKDNIAQSRHSIESARQSKSKFLANMTHEIRTPMNAIVGMTDLILKEDLEAVAREETEIIRDASAELLVLINNILTYSKLDSGKLELLPTKYRFDKLMNEIIQTVAGDIQGRSVELQVSISRDIPITLYGDDIRIKQIFLYLLFSSVKYSDDGRILLEIKGERNAEEQSITFQCRIADTGPGLSQMDIDAIFGAYEHYDSRQGGNLKGLGLELSICRELLRLMGGELDIRSIYGIGMETTFRFTNYIVDDIPIVRIPEGEERRILVYVSGASKESMWRSLMDSMNIRCEYVSGINVFEMKIQNKKYTHIFINDTEYQNLKQVLEKYECEDYTYIVTDYRHVFKDFNNCKIIRRPLSCLNLSEVFNGSWSQDNYQAPADRENIEFPKARILLVDDNMVNLRITAGLLENFKIKPDMVQSGEACIKMLKKEQYHMVLLDQMMPEMDGIQTLHEIRKIPGTYYNNIPILCMTADFGSDVHDKLIKEGFQDYIAKPMKIYYLERFLRKYLPKELQEVGVKNAVEKEQQAQTQTETSGEEELPLSLNPEIGIVSVGGSEEVYATILNTYYREGLEKLEQIPEIYMSGDISLFTTNVHSVKGSSGSVGAAGIAALFKALEMAGKSGDIAYIDENLQDTLVKFSVLLEEVRTYLVEAGAFETETESEAEDDENTVYDKLQIGQIEELQDALIQINLKVCEEMLQDLSSHNYGKEFNKKISNMKSNYEKFDYHKVRDLISELLSEME